MSSYYRSATSTIGILDIAGFENSSINGFEQLCINATNEQLNFYFNQRIFQWELDEYRHEGLDVSNLTFVDNRCVVNLLLEVCCAVMKLITSFS
jgi:myosin-3